MCPFHFETSLNPSQEDLRPIDQGLHEFNLAKLGEEVIQNYCRLAVFARDDAGQVIGGVYGELIWDWLHIDTIWVYDIYRGQGVGSQLLTLIEAVTQSKGFFGSHLETTDFQALEFYLKNGYEVFGALEGKPAGGTWYYMKKQLSSD